METNTLNVALAQIAPVWLDKVNTLKKIEQYLIEAASKGAELVVFGEALLPGYPFWLALTDGAKWNLEINKALHAHYVAQAITIENNELNTLCKIAREKQIAIYIGIIERPLDRGGKSIYASLVYIDACGKIQSVHRKLQPTYDERLTWSPGDGHGLKTHPLKQFTVGGLNCWENWMPLPRAALYAQGEDLHVAVWPGSDHNTKDITRFIARESRSYVLSVSSLMQNTDFPETTPYLNEILKEAPQILANGGSCIAGPDGEWLVEPQLNKEQLIFATLDFKCVLKERQNFDPVGHYARPDVTQLQLNTARQSTLSIQNNLNKKQS